MVNLFWEGTVNPNPLKEPSNRDDPSKPNGWLIDKNKIQGSGASFDPPNGKDATTTCSLWTPSDPIGQIITKTSPFQLTAPNEKKVCWSTFTLPNNIPNGMIRLAWSWDHSQPVNYVKFFDCVWFKIVSGGLGGKSGKNITTNPSTYPTRQSFPHAKDITPNYSTSPVNNGNTSTLALNQADSTYSNVKTQDTSHSNEQNQKSNDSQSNAQTQKSNDSQSNEQTQKAYDSPSKSQTQKLETSDKNAKTKGVNTTQGDATNGIPPVSSIQNQSIPFSSPSPPSPSTPSPSNSPSPPPPSTPPTTPGQMKAGQNSNVPVSPKISISISPMSITPSPVPSTISSNPPSSLKLPETRSTCQSPRPRSRRLVLL